MAKHNVKFTLPERELGRADAEFHVYRDGGKLGTLKISNGALVWVPKGPSYGYRMWWADFGAFMREHGEHLRGV